MRIWNTSRPWVSCDDCLANTAYGETKEEAIEQWNRRADKLEGQPTAYDVDKVVEQWKTDSSVKLYGSGNSDNYLIPVKRAIEIVKGGGKLMDNLSDMAKSNIERIKAESAEIIVTGTKEKPYYEIMYKEVGKNHYNIGYSSYDLNNVFDWKNECFEIVKGGGVDAF